MTKTLLAAAFLLPMTLSTAACDPTTIYDVVAVPVGGSGGPDVGGPTDLTATPRVTHHPNHPNNPSASGDLKANLRPGFDPDGCSDIWRLSCRPSPHQSER